MTYYIYTLSDPITNEIKYVGKTKDLKDRLKRHLSKYYLAESTMKNNWIKKLLSINEKPIMEILDVGDENNINDLEIYWISQLKCWNINLKNMTVGGDGCSYWLGKKHNKESIEKMTKNHPFRKEIEQYDLDGNLVNSYISSHEAERVSGFSRCHITRCCRNIKHYNTVGGYIWRYKEKY